MADRDRKSSVSGDLAQKLRKKKMEGKGRGNDWKLSLLFVANVGGVVVKIVREPSTALAFQGDRVPCLYLLRGLRQRGPLMASIDSVTELPPMASPPPPPPLPMLPSFPT